ncbi:MAG: secreted PhoX family phosphatase [Candidatus Azotimanducaceae bacterium]|jgi:secreted PhoX family phosphatase
MLWHAHHAANDLHLLSMEPKMDRQDIINDPEIGNKAESYEAFDDIPTNANLSRTIGDVINTRYGRRDVLRGVLGVSATTALFGTSALIAPNEAAAATTSRYNFSELAWGNDETHHIADGYEAEVLLRWGDPITADAPEFDVMNQTSAAQLKQFGYNNDYVGFTALNDAGTRGLLCVNHEYTNEEVMFPGLGRQDLDAFKGMTPELIDIEMAAHGGTVVEIAQTAGKWEVVRDGQYNRRITPLNTEMTFSGPAAGHDRMKTTADPEGMVVIGTMNNCAGGMTPWGTYLMAEENFHGYFWTDVVDADGKPDISAQPEAKQMKRYGVPGRWYAWGTQYDRFNIDKEPNEPNRFGWIVEVDPRDPAAKPVKHTALGRFRHEGAETTVSKDGHLVIYSGDDNRFDYQYKYVSGGKVGGDATANSALLSDGTLYAARFDEDGTILWMPLTHGSGPLTAANGFNDQGDVMIDTRLAADLLGATPMDRPEDAQPRGDGTAYIMLTNNNRRKPDQVNAANPRADSSFGHIIEIKEDQQDHAATKGTWSILVKCGDPSIADVGAHWNPETSENGWFGSPDNAAIDVDGRLWISTDQGSNWGKTGKSDGLYALETEGDLRGTSKLFFRTPVGGELCGPYFHDSGETLFLAVQHPGTDGTKSLKGFERNSTFEDPATRWPDFDPKMPPRPSVVVVTKTGGGKIAV